MLRPPARPDGRRGAVREHEMRPGAGCAELPYACDPRAAVLTAVPEQTAGQPQVPRDLADWLPATEAVPPTAGAKASRRGRMHRGGASRANLPAGYDGQARGPARDPRPTEDKDAARRRCPRQGKGLLWAAGPSAATKQ